MLNYYQNRKVFHLSRQMMIEVYTLRKLYEDFRDFSWNWW